MEDTYFYGVIVLLAGAMLGIYFGLVDKTQSKEQIRNAMFTALGITVPLVLVFTFVTYKYFITNTEYTYPYLLLMNGILLLTSISSLAISMINVSHV